MGVKNKTTMFLLHRVFIIYFELFLWDISFRNNCKTFFVHDHVTLLCKTIMILSSIIWCVWKINSIWKAALCNISSINTVAFILVSITVGRSFTELVVESPNVHFWQDIFAPQLSKTVQDLKMKVNCNLVDWLSKIIVLFHSNYS